MMPDPLSHERLEQIRARLNAATRNWDGVQAVHGDVLHRTSPGDRLRLNTHVSWAVGPEARGTPGGAQADADLIAAAPSDLRDLLAEVERLRALVDGDAYRAGQEAMRDRAAGVCASVITRARVEGGSLLDLRCLQKHLSDAIRALEVK